MPERSKLKTSRRARSGPAGPLRPRADATVRDVRRALLVAAVLAVVGAPLRICTTADEKPMDMRMNMPMHRARAENRADRQARHSGERGEAQRHGRQMETA